MKFIGELSLNLIFVNFSVKRITNTICGDADQVNII